MYSRVLRSRRDKRMMRDGRNPYGSRGGYVSSRRSRDREMDNRDYYPERDRGYSSRDYNRDYGRYDSNREYHEQYPRYNDYEYYDVDSRGSRGRDYGYGNEEEEYKEDLRKWIEKLKEKDVRFGLSKDELIEKAKEMGVHFREFSELEFYAIYLAMLSDYPRISNDYHTYIEMAKSFLEDDDIKVSPSEKVCIYLYYIVKGEEI